MSWLPFAASLAIFAGSHYLPAATGWREALIARFGRRAYFTAYGLLSLLLLGWVIAAAGTAPYVEIWPQLAWQRWVPNIAMPFAFVLAACGVGMPQPFTLGGRRAARFDPADPGPAAVTRHPVLLALALWAGAHLVANGDLAHVVVFGGFLAMALVAMRAGDRRAAAALPAADAAAFFGATAGVSLVPLGDGEWWRRNGGRLLPRAAIGLLVWVVALLLHPALIGVSPLPLRWLGG
ncbi:MAG TPA: NnrU family protein [Amaricoccus sp.]|nr:NnrU family protein [Amaricoccus sp.]